MANEILNVDDSELGISPLGLVLVILAAVVGLALFLNPSSTTYDLSIGGVIVLSIAIAPAVGLQRWSNEGDIKKTLYAATLGAAVISVMLMAASFTETSYSIVTGSVILVLALPAIFEELMFRAGVFLALQRVWGTTKSMIVQALLFSLYHFARNPDIQYSIILFVGGIVFQIVFLISKNILSSMLAHAIVNLKPIYMTLMLSPITIAILLGVFLLLISRRFGR